MLTKASILALTSIQGTINLGAIENSTSVDGLSRKVQYKDAPFRGIIKSWQDLEKDLTDNLINQVTGPMVDYF